MKVDSTQYMQSYRKLLGNWERPNQTISFLAGILKSVVIQRNKPYPALSDFKEINNQIQTLRVYVVHERSALFQNHFLNKLLAR